MEAPQRYGSIILHLPPGTLLLFSFCQLLVTQFKMEIVNFLSLIINKIIQIYRQLLLLLSSVQFSLAMAASGLRMLNNNTSIAILFFAYNHYTSVYYRYNDIN